MSSLQNYLQQLNLAESQQGIWVNPENPTEEYRIGQYCFENGGINDNWVCIGTLDDLSFGFQSGYSAFACWVSGGINSESMPRSNQKITYKGRSITVNPLALYEAWTDGSVDEEFAAFIQKEVDSIRSEWSEMDAENFVNNKLPEILESAKELEGFYA